MDFSEAEMAGFTTVFIEFWTLHPDDSQSFEKISAAAQHLLCGC